jgi:hypothetical protein
MDNKTILNFKINDIDKVGMILSNNIDKACSDGGLISVNAFDKLIADLIEWKNSDQCTSKDCPHFATLPIYDEDTGKLTILHICKSAGKLP